MSQKALIKEMVERYGYAPDDAKAMRWPDQIDAVIAGRKEAEQSEPEQIEEFVICPATGEGCVNFGVCAEEGCVQWEDEAEDMITGTIDPVEVSEAEEDAAALDEELAAAVEDDPADVMADATAAAEEFLDSDFVKEKMNEAELAAPGDDGLFDAPAPEDDSDLDPDALMEELSAVKEEQEQYVMQHGLLVKVPGVLDYIFDGHFGAGPSASERWMNCTMSLGASRAFLETLTPNQQETFARSSSAARQGTTAHAAAEVEARVTLGELTQEEANLTMLELAVLPDSDGEAYDEEMADWITEYTDLVRLYAQSRGNEQVRIEHRVSASLVLTNVEEEVYTITGSLDCGVMPTPEEPTLVVTDLKYGEGIDVEVAENPQVRIYALGLLADLVDEEGNLTVPVEDVTYHIAQPRLGGLKTWTEPLDDLLRWRDEVLAPALTKALYGPSEGATYQPSEQACQFCPARGACPALAEDRLTRAADLFDVIVDSEFEGGPGAFPETTSLTDTRLGELLSQISGLIDLHSDLKAEAQRRLFRGDAVPGFGLVNYQPRRTWAEGAESAFEEVPELWQRKMLSPTQAVKLAEANAEEWDLDGLNDWIVKPEIVPVIAKEGDRRKKWTGRPPEAMFDDEGAED